MPHLRLKTLLNENITNEFVKFVAKELQLKSLPASIKFVGSDYSKENLTFGTYRPDTDEIVIVKGNRHIADVLRTLAHEMVHHKQRVSGEELNGEDGSNTENEANAIAGELMRKFRYVRPELYLER
jgi:Zn-dependent peptidase ImmA (M78 family)